MLTRSIPLVLYSMVPFVIMLVTEYVALRQSRPRKEPKAGKRGFRGYAGKDTFASLAMGVLSMVPGAVINAGSVPIALWAWHHRFFTLGTGVATWVFAILLVDFAEYWNHRAGHRVRFLWANHVQHHSSQYMNFSTSLRTPISSFSNLFFFPWLAIFGIQPWIVFAAFSINAIYQLWVHTEIIGKLPKPIEYVFVTPSHHRVHHGSDNEYIDKNFAGIFIFLDRIFGTFQAEDAPVTYGLIHNIESHNLWTIATHEYKSMAKDVRTTKGVGGKLGRVIMPPGWEPSTTPTTPAPSTTPVA